MPVNDPIRTSQMLSHLRKSSDINAFIEHNAGYMQNVALPDYLQNTCSEKGLVREHVIAKADIERTYGHQIFRGLHTPSRDKTIQLAFGFGFDVDETQELLRVARHSLLYPKLMRDAVIIFCLEKRYTVTETQDLLHELGLSLLGGK